MRSMLVRLAVVLLAFGPVAASGEGRWIGGQTFGDRLRFSLR